MYVLWPFIFSFVEKYIYVCTTLHIYILHIIYVVTEEEGESLPSARSRDREQSLRPFLKNGQRKRATTRLLRRCIDVKKMSTCILDMKMIYLGSKCKVSVVTKAAGWYKISWYLRRQEAS